MTELVEWVHQGKPFIGTPQELVDELTYASYKHTRQTAPHLDLKGWEPIYGNKVDRLEARYQHETSPPSPSYLPPPSSPPSPEAIP